MSAKHIKPDQPVGGRGGRFALVCALSVCLFGGIPRAALAQEDISQKTISSLDLEQADVREALRVLFKNVNVSYSIAPEVQGAVTVSLKNATFETALQNILRQVDGTYRIEGGVYEIVRRVDSISPNANTPDTPIKTDTKIIRRIKIRSADPEFIAMMIGQKEGSQSYNVAPERSTIVKTQSSGGSGMGSGSRGGGGMSGGGLGGGSLGGGSGSGFGSGSGSFGSSGSGFGGGFGSGGYGG
ncbi:MAG: hypothetical protein P4L46_17135 [Fimbriimonas sp.]|nr:hypothetical protein [Fimbriimonas sp.]